MQTTEENKKNIEAYLDNLRDTLDTLGVDEDGRGFFVTICGKKWRPQEEERTDPWVMTGTKEYEEKLRKIKRLEEEVSAQVVLIDAYVAKAERQGEDTKTIVMPVTELREKGKELARLRHRLSREIELRSRAIMEREEYEREIIGLRKTIANLRAEQAKREISDDISDT